MMLLLTTAELDPAIARFAFLAKITMVILLVSAILLWKRSNQVPSRQDFKTWGLAGKMCYSALLVALAVLSFTSLVSIWRYHSMHGWWLVAHMIASGVFVVAVTLVALFLTRRLIEQSQLPTAFAYLLVLLMSLLVMGSILLSMYPLFGTEEMRRLISVHRYSGLGLLSVTVLHALLVRFC